MARRSDQFTYRVELKFKFSAVLGCRAADLQEQAGGPIANPMEMGFTHDLAVGVLASIPQYVQSFKDVYNVDKITINEVTDAIAEFEETLVTPNAPFDQWLKGDKDALTAEAKAGYKLFKDVGLHRVPQWSSSRW